MNCAMWKMFAIILICGQCSAPITCLARSDSTQTQRYLNLFQESLKAADDFLAHVTAIPDSQEMVIGKSIAERVNSENSLIRGRMERRVRLIGKKLAPFTSRKGITYTIQLMDSKKLNAFAVPGGNIWVTKAMLDFVDNDDELAGIIGHEIAHVDLRHCIRSIQYQIWISNISPDHLDYVRIGHSLLNSGYNQLNELEADQQGVRIMHQAGYDPVRMIDFMAKLEALEAASGAYKLPSEDDTVGQVASQVTDFLRSHPLSRERREKLEIFIRNDLKK